MSPDVLESRRRRLRRPTSIGRPLLPGAATAHRAGRRPWIDAILDRNLDDYDDSGWRYALFVAILAGYSAGVVAGSVRHGADLTNGALAGTLTFVLWVPVRILIWVARDEHEALFTGTDPVFKPGQIFGHLVIASALGMVGGTLGARVVVKRNRLTAGGPRRIGQEPDHGARPAPRGRILVGGQRGGRVPGLRPGVGPRNVRTPQGRVLGNAQSG